MISHDTPVDLVSIRRGLWWTSAVAIVATSILYVFDTDTTITAACILGAMAGLLPIRIRARQANPKNVEALMTLSRHSTKSFCTWLAMMVIYLVAGCPLGIKLFEAITGMCVAGLFFSRGVFPSATILLMVFRPSSPASGDSSART